MTDAKLLYDATADKRPGSPDGMKVDKEGNIYSTGPGGVCDTKAGVCNSVNGICAQPYLDKVGCGTGVVDGGLPFITLTGGCAGGAKDNNGTGGTNVCFVAGPGPTTFPYLLPGAANQ